MRIRPIVAAALALIFPVTAMAQPLPATEPAPAPAPPVVDAPIIVPVPVVPPPPTALGPRTLPYEEGGPIPQGYTLREKPRLGLVIGGAAALGALYLISLFSYTIAEAACEASSSSCADGLWPLTLPVVGPFVTIGTADARNGGLSLLLMDGIGQGAGLAMLILGIVSKKKVWVRADVGDLHLLPVAFASGGRGLALSGRF